MLILNKLKKKNFKEFSLIINVGYEETLRSVDYGGKKEFMQAHTLTWMFSQITRTVLKMLKTN